MRWLVYKNQKILKLFLPFLPFYHYFWTISGKLIFLQYPKKFISCVYHFSYFSSFDQEMIIRKENHNEMKNDDKKMSIKSSFHNDFKKRIIYLDSRSVVHIFSCLVVRVDCRQAKGHRGIPTTKPLCNFTCYYIKWIKFYLFICLATFNMEFWFTFHLTYVTTNFAISRKIGPRPKCL